MRWLWLWLWLIGSIWSIGPVGAQRRQVQGVVKSAEGEALPGVTVLVDGTNGASTGGDGGHTVTLPANADNATLRFSYVGLVPKG